MKSRTKCDLDLDLENFAQGQIFEKCKLGKTIKGEGESQPKCQIQNIIVKG